MAQHFHHRIFGGPIGIGNEISRALAGHLQRIHFPEIAAQLGRGLARGLFHDGDKRAMGDHGEILAAGVNARAAIGEWECERAIRERGAP